MELYIARLAMILFCKLLVGHALADYPWQGDFLAKAKCRSGIPGVPWRWALSWHCVIHAGMVGFLTTRADLAIAEFVVHWGIDYSKCRGWIGFNTDQVLHILCKLIWVFVVLTCPQPLW
jgi:hypothetical protein